MNSQRVWNLIRVVVAVSLVLQSVVSFSAIPVSAKTVTPIAAQNAEPFVSPVVTPQPTPQPSATVEATVTPEPSKAAVLTGTLILSETVKTLDATGGQLTSADKRIQLDVPAGLFKDATRMSITPRAAEQAKAQSGLLFQFDLQAQDEAGNKALAAFNKSITLTVDLNGLIDRAKLQPFEHLAIFYQTNNPDAPWSELLDAREVSPGIVQVPLAHFSTYAAAVSGDVPASWHLKYIPPTVGLFSGAMTFAYPIEVPAGRHGLQPNVAVAYSSRTIDGLTYLASEDTDGVPLG